VTGDKDNQRNYYRILHVQPDAPLEVIKASYRTIMQRLKAHPDLGGDHWNAAIINEAYGVLTDPEQRADYDRAFLPTLGWRAGGDAGEAGSRHRKQRAGEPAAVATRRFCAFCRTPFEPGAHREAESLCTACGSPLTAAGSPRLEASWQRNLDRMPKDHPVEFWTNWPQHRPFCGRSRDLSPAGMQVMTDHAVDTGGFIKIDSDLLKAVGRIAYCHPRGEGPSAGFVVGVEFYTLLFARTRGAFVSTRA